MCLPAVPAATRPAFQRPPLGLSAFPWGRGVWGGRNRAACDRWLSPMGGCHRGEAPWPRQSRVPHLSHGLMLLSTWGGCKDEACSSLAETFRAAVNDRYVFNPHPRICFSDAAHSQFPGGKRKGVKHFLREDVAGLLRVLGAGHAHLGRGKGI